MLDCAYDISATYEENYRNGPKFSSELSECDREEGNRVTFLGLPVRGPIGIAAGLLLNSTWIAAYAARGFDILTYKTVRSSYRPCYPLPNWVFVQERSDGRYEAIDSTRALAADPREISSSVCFGMPSMAPEIWRDDIAEAKASLRDGQLLIVSVVATPDDHWGADEVVGDFVKCARWAAEAGADLIEANLSCPNVCSAEGSIYLDTALSHQVASNIKGAIGTVPLLTKIGHFEDDARLAEFLGAIDGHADGVTLVNCLIREVVHPDGSPVFGETFAKAGVLGRAIHDSCVSSVRRTSACIQRHRHSLEIAAVGGVSSPDDVKDFLAAGANVVMLGSSPMYVPDLGWKLTEALAEVGE